MTQGDISDAMAERFLEFKTLVENRLKIQGEFGGTQM